MWKVSDSRLRDMMFLCSLFTGVVLLCAICVLIMSSRVFILLSGLEYEGSNVEAIHHYSKILMGVSATLCLVAPFGTFSVLTKRRLCVGLYSLALFSMSVVLLTIGHKSLSRRPQIQNQLEKGMIQAFKDMTDDSNRYAVEKMQRMFGCQGVVSVGTSYGCLDAIINQYTIVVWIVILVGSLQLLGVIFSAVYIWIIYRHQRTNMS